MAPVEGAIGLEYLSNPRGFPDTVASTRPSARRKTRIAPLWGRRLARAGGGGPGGADEGTLAVTGRAAVWDGGATQTGIYGSATGMQR